MREPVLFLPGLLCDARLWRDPIAGLGDTIIPNVADLTHDDRIEAMADRAIAPMPQRFAVCGLSMGGYVALAILRRAAARVTRLCLMDTSARPDTAEQSRRRRGLMGLTRRNQFRGVTPRLLPQLLHPDHLADHALTGAVMGMAERIGRDAFLRQQTAILHRTDSRPHLSAIAVPTLVMIGSHDALTPLELSQEMAASIPQAQLAVVQGAGHLPPMERPDAVTAFLRDWLGTAS